MTQDLFKKLIQAGYLINIGIYAVNSVGQERKRKDEEIIRIQKVFRSTLVASENLSIQSGVQENSSRKRPSSSPNPGLSDENVKKNQKKRLTGTGIARKSTNRKRQLDSLVRKGCSHKRK